MKGEALPEEIDDFVDAWHEGTSGDPLHAFLGMTREEYGRWVEEPAALSLILEARNETVGPATTEAWSCRTAARDVLDGSARLARSGDGDPRPATNPGP